MRDDRGAIRAEIAGHGAPIDSGDAIENVNLDAELSAVGQAFAAAIAATCALPKHDRIAARRVLQNAKKAALREITERRKQGAAARAAAKASRSKPKAKPQ